MAKIGEEFITEGDKIIHKKNHDWSEMIARNKMMRDAGADRMGESVLIGSIDADLIGIWLKEAGVSWDDPARGDVIKKKMLSGDFDKLRVWKGKY